MEFFALTVLVLVLYLLPTLIAHKRRQYSVFALNLFLGWTLLGWVVALVMAIRSREVA